MLPGPHNLREIVWQPLFEQELLQLGFDAARADEFAAGATWVLARNPKAGVPVAKNVWFLPMGRPADGKALNIFYAFDEHRVYFLSIQRAPEEVE